MEIKKSYITDESGTIKNVVIDLNTFRKKAMNEVQDDVEEAKILLKQHEG